MNPRIAAVFVVLVWTGSAAGGKPDASSLDRPAPQAQARPSTGPSPTGIPIRVATEITLPGKYVVVRNITAPGTVIRIDSDDVDLDLNGFTLTSTGSGDPVIRVFPSPPDDEIESVTVRDGHLRGGGVCLFADRVTRLRVSGLKTGGCNTGLFLEDLREGGVIEHNEIGKSGNESFGLFVDNCWNCRINENTITGGVERGLSINFAQGGEIRGNLVRASTVCFWIDGAGVLFRDNVAAQCSNAIEFLARDSLIQDNLLTDAGIGLRLNPSATGNVYRGNVARNINNDALVDQGSDNTSHGDNYLPGQR